MKGKLEPSLEEQMEKNGKAKIHVTLFNSSGKVTTPKGEEEYIVGMNPNNVVVHYKKRTVLFDMIELVSEAVQIIEEDRKEK